MRELNEVYWIDGLTRRGNPTEETDEAVLRRGLPMAPSVLLQTVGPRVAWRVLETMHDAYPDRFPLSETLRAIGGDRSARARQRAGDRGRR